VTDAQRADTHPEGLTDLGEVSVLSAPAQGWAVHGSEKPDSGGDGVALRLRARHAFPTPATTHRQVLDMAVTDAQNAEGAHLALRAVDGMAVQILHEAPTVSGYFGATSTVKDFSQCGQAQKWESYTLRGKENLGKYGMRGRASFTLMTGFRYQSATHRCPVGREAMT